MKKIQHVLAALDLGREGDRLTEGSRKALGRAVSIARTSHASLTLLHSEKPDEYWHPETETFVQGYGRGSKRQQLLDATVAELSEDGVKVRLVVRPETAWLAIVHEVLREGIDLVVAGKRTSLYSDDRALGSVARKLLRKCPCTVWLEDPRETKDPSVILAATDLTPVGDRVVELSASIADLFGAELHIVHAYSLSMEAQFEGGESRATYEREHRDAALHHIRRSLEATPMTATARLHVGLTSPTHAILEGVNRLRPGLVVMGTVSRGGIPGLLVGNTAERLFDRLDCALLTVKPEDFACPVTLPPAD